MRTTSCSSPAESWLKQHKGEPFVATYLGVTGHHDYRPIDRYGLKDYSKLPGLDHYQNEMRYLDFFVRNVIDQYKELGLYDDTIFVIYGDHGEGFGEHDLYQHDNTIYQEGLKVPFIIHAPGRFREANASRPYSNQLDILPTLFDLLGYKVTGGHYPGRSLVAPPDGGPHAVLFLLRRVQVPRQHPGHEEIHLLLRQPA